MAGLIYVFSLTIFFLLFGIYLQKGVLIGRILDHNLFDSPLHHAIVLLRVHMLSLRLILHVLNFTNVALLLFAFYAIIDVGSRSRWFVEEGMELKK